MVLGRDQHLVLKLFEEPLLKIFTNKWCNSNLCLESANIFDQMPVWIPRSLVAYG